MPLTDSDLNALRILMREEVTSAFDRYDREIALPRHNQVLEHIDDLAHWRERIEQEFVFLKAQFQRMQAFLIERHGAKSTDFSVVGTAE